MSAGVYREEPGKIASGVLAVVVHVAFLALLIVGVSWQRREAPPVIVDLWNALPPVPVVKPPEPEPKPKPQVQPPPPPKVEEVKPVPKLVPKPAPEPKPVVKPDISLEKEKQEKARRELEEREKAEARKVEEAKKREALAKAEARRLEEEKKEKERQKVVAALEAQRVAKEAERARIEKEQQDALQRLQQQQAAAHAAARAKYIAEISAKIRRYIVVPPDIKGNPQVEFDVVLLPTGDVLGVKLKKGSQYAAYDSAVERAIMKAQPLPVPKDPAMFREFRELSLQFRPNE